MTDNKTSDLHTVIVLETETMVRPDGRAGIRLLTQDEETRERAATVFEVTLEMIAAIRHALAVAEQHIRQSQSRTSH
jgi:hypothetical protein